LLRNNQALGVATDKDTKIKDEKKKDVNLKKAS